MSARTPSVVRVRVGLVGLLVALPLGATAACGGDSSSGGSGGSGGSSSASSTPVRIDITVTGDSVTPNGTVVQAKRGQDVDLHITAQKPGELHVHSSPEQHVEYAAGTTDKTLRFERPGVIEIEDHALDKLVVKLQVR